MTTKTIREIALAWKSDKQRYVKQGKFSIEVQKSEGVSGLIIYT